MKTEQQHIEVCRQMKKLTRTEAVTQWWDERLSLGRQLVKGDTEREPLARPMTAKFPWKERVSTTKLWEDFACWSVNQNFNWHQAEFTKTGFMTIFYRVSGAKMSTMRVKNTSPDEFSGGMRIKVAKFKNVTWHRDYVKELKDD